MSDTEVSAVRVAKWHIQLFIFLILQTASAVWWASSVTLSLEYLKASTAKEQIESARRIVDVEIRLRTLENFVNRKHPDAD